MSDDQKQNLLFKDLVFKEPWEDDWEGMPEFKQDDRMPYRTIFVHFKTREDVELFSMFIEQKIGPKTKYLWFPKPEIFNSADYVYADKCELDPDDIEVDIEDLEME